MRRVSVTELVTWQECRRCWHYKFERRLLPKQLNPMMESGRAIAAGIEAGFADHSLPDERVAKARRFLDAEYRWADEKFRAGAMRAVEAVPPWVWATTNAYSEQKLVVDYPTSGVQMVGRPDLLLMSQEQALVVEFKSTGKRGREAESRLKLHELTGQQVLQYCVLVADNFKWLDRPLFRQHILLTTSGECHEGGQFPVTPLILDRARGHMLASAGEVGKELTLHNRGGDCMRCDFNLACTAYFDGGDDEAVLKEITHE